MLISERSKEIIGFLIDANHPLTVSDIAKKLDVTERTIYRQMPEVIEIIESYDLTLDNSTGKGIQIWGSLYNLRRLGEAFQEVKAEVSYSAKERTDLIILTLLNEDTYIKTQTFAIDLNTSSQTIRNDYQNLKEKIKKHNVQFETKKSEGVRIYGKEIPKRHLFVNIILKNVTPDNFFDWLKGGNYKENAFIELLDRFGYLDILSILYEQLYPLIHAKHLTLSDSEFQEFILLLAIFICRHPNMKDQTDILKLNINVIESSDEFKQSILSLLDSKFDLIPYDNELDYFNWMMNLYTGRTHYQIDNQTAALRSLNDVSQLIGLVESKFHFPFHQDKNLAENMMLHVNMALERIESGIIVQNPMLDEIYNSNPKLYNIVKESVIEIFGKDVMPEDEIGYIAVYFIASIDFLSKKSISVLVVCSTGIGSSKMLRSRLEREFSEIDVKKLISLHKLPEEDLSNYDFVISTVPLDLDTNKYLCVSPLLNEKEKEETRKRIQNLHKKGDYYHERNF